VELGSDLDRYRVARAVMASASFPAVFNYMTVRDYHEEAEAHRRGERGKRYRHLSFDGLPEGELKERLDTIATNFRLAKGDAAAMDQAVVALVSAANPQLQAVRTAILAGD